MHRHSLITAATHQTYAALLDLARRSCPGVQPNSHLASDPSSGEGRERDRGAVSLEQVLWFVAAGVSVAVVAAVVWAQIRQQAETDIIEPTAP